MKKLSLLFVMSLLAGTMAFAQNDKTAAPKYRAINKTEMVKMRTERMVKNLGLNQAQADSLLALNTEFADQMPGMRMPGRQQRAKGSDSTSVEARRNFMETRKAAVEKYNNRLKSFLTEEQMTKYNEMHKQRMQNMRGKHRMPRQSRNFTTSNDD